MEDNRRLGNERRQSERFPIQTRVRYRVLSKRTPAETGEGETIDISSHGVCFKPPAALTLGLRLEMCISWPAQLNDKCALNLVVRGRVVRVTEDRAAIEVQQHEFRTSGAGC
ncbi:MAG: PilZ domain-containing protein [Bryobacterales bacterium]|nr:PilZ domain-containing protein [Bryobacterales bacterium]MBV9398249.1 PilZ domain-containing protein [Bryobacterales bacterium]